MKERITNIQMQDFLNDFEQNSETIILEEGKEKNEILAIAKVSRINLKNNRDLAGFKTIYTFANKANKNRARLPKKALLKALPGMIGKPVDINHKRRYVIGHYIDYRYKQKEDMVVAYGVFYKSNFGDEWAEAKKLFKAKKLTTSYEIWCPDNQRKDLADGTYELLQQEIAGGALLFGQPPAFADAKVLELAMRNSEKYESELVFAEKYKDEELIIAGEAQVVTEPAPQVAPKLKCSNCAEEFEYHDTGEIKCPKCFAILNKSGQMIYPPQMIDFKVLCPSCKINRWLLLSKTEDGAKVRCLHDAKEYEITFAKRKLNKDLEKLDFIYIGTVSCYQCNKAIEFSGVSSVKTRNFECPRCGLQFSHDVTRTSRKKVSKITEIDKSEKSSEKGGKPMKIEKKVEKASEKKAEAQEQKIEKKEDVKVEKKVEEKPEVVVKPKAEEKTAGEPSEAKAEEAPKAEEKKVEEKAPKTVEEPKKAEKKEETKPKAEAKKEEPKVEKKAETKTAEKVEKKEEAKVEEKPKAEKKEEVKVEEKVEEAKETKEQKYAKGLRKFASMYRELKKSMIKEVAFYKANAEEINKRKADLGDYGKDLSDVDILKDEKFAEAKAKKENATIEKSSVETVGKKTKDEDYYTTKRNEIDRLAFDKK